MQRKRARRVVFISALACVALALATGYVCRGFLLELWLVSRLESTEPTVRLQAVEALGRLGSPRAFEPLMDHVRTESESHGATLAVLAKIAPKVGREQQGRFVDLLLELARTESASVNMERADPHARERRRAGDLSRPRGPREPRRQ